MGDTSIQWTDKTWTPLRAKRLDNGKVGVHCVKVSAGCAHCYSETFNKRTLPNQGTGLPFTHASTAQVEVFIDEKILLQPLRWRTPKMVFVCSQTDLFAEFVDDWMIDRLLAVMALTPQHTYQILTKRPDRMRAHLSEPGRLMEIAEDACTVAFDASSKHGINDVAAVQWGGDPPVKLKTLPAWPLPNVWLGVSAENQETLKRAWILCETPAAMRFVSLEPLLEPVDLNKLELLHAGWRKELTIGRYLDWVIVGGESGPGSRPFDVKWARHAVYQCRQAGVACFVKQMGSVPIMPGCRQNHWDWGGSWGHTPKFSNFSESPPMWRIHLADRKGGDIEEWANDLRVREFPPTDAQRR